MKKINNIFPFVLCGLLLMLTACKESFPDIEYDDSYMNKELSTIEGSNAPTPIIPVFGDPQYSISTRGTGVFYDYNLDAKHWLDAEFKTFAFLSDNSFSRSDALGYADYTKKDTLHTLLYNQSMKLVGGNGQVMFVNENGIKQTKYYNFNRQNWKYKFFTYFADDCALESTLKVTSDNKVKIDIDIDGSQDVIHSFASHNDEQFEEAINRLPNEDQRLVMKNYGQEILYSSVSGHHQIHPIFNANHLLSRLDFQICGATGGEGNDFFKSVVVRSIKIRSKHRGTLTIANDKWDAATYNSDVESNQILVFDNNMKYLQLKLDTIRANDANNGGWEELTTDPLYTYKDEDAQFHISSTAIKNLGKPILLPPADEYEVRMAIDFLDFKTDENGKITLNHEPYSLNDVTYNIKYQDLASGSFQPFLAGHAYTILISVYGPQEITATLNLKSWVTDDDGDGTDNKIEVGGDEEDY